MKNGGVNMQSLNFLFEQIKKIAQILIDNPEIIKDKEGIETSHYLAKRKQNPKSTVLTIKMRENII